MNYAIDVSGGFDSDIYLTNDDADGVDVFSTFKEAKQALLDILEGIYKYQIDLSVYRVSNMSEEDVQEGWS